MEPLKGQSADFNHGGARASACVSCLHVAGVQKGSRGTNWEASKEKEGRRLFETQVFTSASALYLRCPVLFVVLCRRHPACPSVRPSSCSVVQNHLDHQKQQSSPCPVMSLDLTRVDSMSSSSVCVCLCVSRPYSAVHVNLFIRENAHKLCVFVCMSMTQRDSELLKRPQLYFHCSRLV